MQEKQPSPERWHLGKTVELAHIMALAGAILAFIYAVNEFDDRVDRLEYRADITDKALAAEREYVRETYEEIREDLNYIRQRMDKECLWGSPSINLPKSNCLP